MPKGFFDKVGGAIGLKKKVARWQLTEIGEDRHVKMEMGGTRFEILASVKKLQPASSTQEVADDMHWSAGKMQRALEALKNEGLVENVG